MGIIRVLFLTKLIFSVALQNLRKHQRARIHDHLFSLQRLFAVSLSTTLLLCAGSIKAQTPSTADDATVTYPAEYFAQYQPFRWMTCSRVSRALTWHRVAVAVREAGQWRRPGSRCRRRSGAYQWQSSDSRERK